MQPLAQIAMSQFSAVRIGTFVITLVMEGAKLMFSTFNPRDAIVFFLHTFVATEGGVKNTPWVSRVPDNIQT